MIRVYETDQGKTVSAESREAAEALAAQYNMGRIISAHQPVRGPQRMAEVFACWNSWAEREEFRGTLMDCAAAVYEDPNLTVLAVGDHGLRKLRPVERRALRRLLQSAG